MVAEASPAWEPHLVLHHGAEAVVSEGFCLGQRSVLKVRRPRNYRHPDLDRRLTRQRMSVEAKVLDKLSAMAFPSPSLLNLDHEGGWIVLSKIDGEPLHDQLKSESPDIGSLRSLGQIIRRLHSIGISHGDLTTHNVLYSQDGSLHLIDFGLSRQTPELEHLGLDLQILNECLTATHSKLEGAMGMVIESYIGADKTYKGIPKSSDVIERFHKIASRVRYHG
ncbi:MAG TPA: KEOPS complex kinase/ATPase Bud32 [Candidatus Thalassarchaeaceae archaeon]|nr:KEOPS complex kinase/ATPase Bud32 [Candidatus Thalassarchaeaceae archaeon]